MHHMLHHLVVCGYEGVIKAGKHGIGQAGFGMAKQKMPPVLMVDYDWARFQCHQSQIREEGTFMTVDDVKRL